jgi:hypothetical protein
MATVVDNEWPGASGLRARSRGARTTMKWRTGQARTPVLAAPTPRIRVVYELRWVKRSVWSQSTIRARNGAGVVMR